MHQFQEAAKPTRIAQEIRARKSMEENGQIQPFRSHRKQPPEENLLRPIPQNEIINVAYQPQSIKLNREYPSEVAQGTQPDGKKKPERFKYDLTKLAQSVTRQQVTSKYLPTQNDSQSRLPASKYCTSIKKCTTNSNQGAMTINRIQRNEVKSIIFDSKVEPFDCRYSTPNPKEIERQSDMEISMLKEKVDKVNHQIAEGISKLEKLIETIKQKKGKESTVPAGRVRSKSETTNEQQNQQPAQLTQESLEEKAQKRAAFFKKRQSPQIVKQQEGKQPAPVEMPIKEIKNQSLAASDSQAELAGGFKNKLSKFPPQYNSFVNRLSNQIQIDMEFTNMISELSKNRLLPKVKDLILNEIKKYQPEVKIDQSFFQIQPSEIDPLDLSKPYFILKNKDGEEDEQALKVFNKYKEIQSHFDNKLKNQFDSSIIKLLFEELAKFNCNKMIEESNAATTGHLLSYLNMRTNRSYRNRFFVKMSKRLGVKPNTNLVPDSFRTVISP